MKNEKQHLSNIHILVKIAESENKLLNHENKGFLSFSNGFMPQITPLSKLPSELTLWDEIASQLPLMFKTQTVRQNINQLPDLSSAAIELEDKYLLRASSILCFLAHAFVRSNKNTIVPSNVMKPWKLISDRLNRPAPFMSYIDLIVYNNRLIDPNGKFEVENLDLLIPIIGNQEERVFYLVQTEILQTSRMIFQEVIRIHDAILIEDNHSVENSLKKIKKVIFKITHQIFPKINPNPKSKTYVNPIVWAKTVAPFAVPIQENIQGPSGTSSPFFHMMDCFLERRLYNSELGKESLLIREWYPSNWQKFLVEISQVSFREYLLQQNSTALIAAYNEVRNAYSGANGFFDVHKKKVYSYLQTAFKVGRRLTIGGFQGDFDDRTWEEVDDALIDSKSERVAIGVCPFANKTTSNQYKTPNNGLANEYFPSEVASHRNEKTGFWIAINQYVFDLTHFLSKHPGGKTILLMHVGLDASQEFQRSGHNSSPLVMSMINKYQIGKFVVPAFSNQEIQTRYVNWSKTLALCLEMLNAFELDVSIRESDLIPLEERIIKNKIFLLNIELKKISPLKKELFQDLLERFINEYLGPLFRHLYKCTSSEKVRKSLQLLKTTMKELFEHSNKNREDIMEQRIDQNLEFLQQLKKVLIEGNQVFEEHYKKSLGTTNSETLFQQLFIIEEKILLIKVNNLGTISQYFSR